MPKKLNAFGRPLWQKIIIIPLLPALILFWMIGWTLTQIGSQNTSIEINQRTKLNNTTSQQHEEKIPDDKEQRIVYEPEILA